MLPLACCNSVAVNTLIVELTARATHQAKKQLSKHAGKKMRTPLLGLVKSICYGLELKLLHSKGFSTIVNSLCSVLAYVYMFQFCCSQYI